MVIIDSRIGIWNWTRVPLYLYPYPYDLLSS
jgi:hypothetical protein